MSVVTDRLKGNPAALPQRVSAYEPDIVAAQDYYPFGQVMRGRNFPTLLGKSNFPTKYRYGFNDKEADADGEIQNLTTYDYGFRIYNPGIARFLSVDPLTSSYPSWSPYPFAMNRPIDGIDLDGLEYVNSTTGEYDPYPNGAYHGDANDDFYDTKAKNHQNHQQDLIDKGFLPSAPLVTITDERPAPAKVDPSTIQSTPNGIYFSSTSGISHYFNDNTSIANRTTYLWSGEKWDLIRSEQQQYKNNLITVDAFINALANFTVGAISLFDFGISPGTLTGFRASYIAAKGVTAPKGWITEASKKGGGTVFKDPSNPHNIIRQMPGNPNSPNVLQQNPYIKFMKEGKFYDVNGKVLPNGNVPEAHIPLDQFNINNMPKF